MIKKTKYLISKKIGEGAYGIVSEAHDEKGNKVAIKEIKDLTHIIDCIKILREIRILKFFTKYSHPNIIKLVDLQIDNSNNISIITKKGDTDLHELIFRYRESNKNGLTEEHYKFILFQILSGVNHLHHANIIHRDMTPSNIIINKDCSIQIIDFGLSRCCIDTNMTEYVVTRWYRAPEIILSPNRYNKKIDVWAIGCIMVELITKQPLFKVDNYIQLIKKIIKIIDVNKNDVSSVDFGLQIINEEIKKKNKNTTFNKYFREIEKKNLYSNKIDKFCPISDTLLKIITNMLSFNPNDRPTIDDIVTNKYFKDYQYKLKKYKKSPIVFSQNIRVENALIETNDLDSIKKLIYNECKT